MNFLRKKEGKGAAGRLGEAAADSLKDKVGFNCLLSHS